LTGVDANDVLESKCGVAVLRFKRWANDVMRGEIYLECTTHCAGVFLVANEDRHYTITVIET
jgi:hypothetical protein